jgi:hypothetical protein
MCSFSWPLNPIAGTYTVSSNDPAQIELVLTADQHFTYRDFSDAQHKIVVNGQWTLEGHKILLAADQKNIRHHDKWVLAADQNSIHSRKGLCRYRLCKK